MSAPKPEMVTKTQTAEEWAASYDWLWGRYQALGQEVYSELAMLREALEGLVPVAVRAFNRIHGLPRATDTELASALEIAIGTARSALRKATEKDEK